MTVRELIDELQCFDDDMEVAVRGSNTDYIDSVGTIKERNFRAFWGPDGRVVVIRGDGQIGAV
jgi:hypothetical protein